MTERRRMHIQSKVPTYTLCNVIVTPMRYMTAIDALATPDHETGGWCDGCRNELAEIAEQFVTARSNGFQHVEDTVTIYGARNEF